MAIPQLSEQEYARRWLAGEQMDPSSLYDPTLPPPPAPVQPPIAMGGAGGTSAVDPYGGAPVGNVPDVPIEQPGAGGAGGTLNLPPVNLSGATGPGNLPADVPAPQPMAATEAPAAPPAPAVAMVPETTVRPKPAPKPGSGAASTRPAWLNKYAAAEGLNPAPSRNFRTDPLGVPFTRTEGALDRETEDEAFGTGIAQQEAAIERGRLEAVAQSQAEAFQAAKLAEDAQRRMEHTRELEGMEQNARELFNEVTNDPIDPNRYWNSLNTGEQIGQSIALFLGTIGAGAAGQPNLVYEKMKSRIDNDLAAQAKNKEFKLRRAMGEQTLVDLARNRFEDENVAQAVGREAAYRNLNSELARWKQLISTPEQQLALDQFITAANNDLNRAEADRRMAMDAYTLQRMQLMAGRKAKKPPRNEVKNLVESISAQDTVIKKLGRIKELTSRAMSRVPGADDKARAEALTTSLLFDIKRAEQLGALDKGTVEVFESYIGTPSDFFRSPGSEAKLDQIIQIAEGNKLKAQREYETMQGVETSAPTRGGGEGNR